MTPVVKFSARSFIDAMQKFSKQSGLEMGDVLRYQMALWCKDLIAKTASNPSWSLGEQYRRGRAAIAAQWADGDDAAKLKARKANAGDLLKLFQPFDNNSITATWKERRKNAKHKGERVVKLTDGSLIYVDDEHWKPDKDNIAQLHQSHRNSRGRVKYRGEKYWISKGAFARYVRKMWGDVGKTKAGWLPAANFFAAKARGLVAKVAPAWVARHFGKNASGAFADTINAQTMIGGVTASNSVPWVRDDDGIMHATLRTRLRDLEQQMWKRIPDIAKKLGFTTKAD